MPLPDVDLNSLAASATKLKKQYRDFQAQQLKLDMTRGKPCAEQLDLANPLLSILDQSDYLDASGVDCRNYGVLDGISEAKTLFADYLQVSTDELFIGGNSSLGLMHDLVARCISHGAADSEQPWAKLEKIKFLCPAPGYDRHFAICQHFSIEMISVALLENGDPDMEHIERLVASDASIKGLWFVPKYGNPSGLSVSDQAVDRLAKMPCAAADFRIFWDNAYNVHHLTPQHVEIKNLLRACQQAGNDNRAFVIGSTSKISFAGAGIAALGASRDNINWLCQHVAIQTIGSDKINQLRHLRFFKNLQGIKDHMLKHSEILAPKFQTVDRVLNAQLSGKHLAQWSKPKGGYFINLDVLDNCATKVVAMARDAGVVLTAAGATFPYGKDPRDRNIRIAPSLPSVEQIELAMQILSVCIELVSIEVLSDKQKT
ncbi:MAG: aminotransferase, putative [Osedax symbiont Rs2]|nr:MAG: aminotransferase, putative [Osedax symbiont Rs2]